VKKYNETIPITVTVRRDCWALADFTVDVDVHMRDGQRRSLSQLRDEAEREALKRAGDHEFGSGNADYEVEMVQYVRPISEKTRRARIRRIK